MSNSTMTDEYMYAMRLLPHACHEVINLNSRPPSYRPIIIGPKA